MDHITHDEFADRLEKIMEPLISRPSFEAKIAFFHGDVSGYNPYGTDRLHGAKAVSYTHLDVYKRQSFILSISRRLCSSILWT